MKTKLLTITKKDCRFDYFKGHGAGGQKKNKTENYCRCTHIASGAVGMGQDGRSKEKNRQLAFKRMAGTKEFKQWLMMKSAEASGKADEIRKWVDNEMINNIRVEVYQDGKWNLMENNEKEILGI